MRSFNRIRGSTLVKAFVRVGDGGEGRRKFSTGKWGMRGEMEKGCKGL